MYFSQHEATTSKNIWKYETEEKSQIEIAESKQKESPRSWESLRDNGVNEVRMTYWSKRNYGAVGTCSIIEVHPDEKADDHEPPQIELPNDETEDEIKINTPRQDVMTIPKLSRYEAQEVYEKRIAEIFAPVRTSVRILPVRTPPIKPPKIEKKEEHIDVTSRALMRVRKNLRNESLQRRSVHRIWCAKLD
ncbi:unnamed protein product [Caenorhabditis angaria]|uniref:Uncharacterized protein n=1 Tax=Caenorhabditis angaria TaxID=860376 RepID=A0A9P1NB75_9PELO|nr:unnamed protein product [Caenorhabditis angaria]